MKRYTERKSFMVAAADKARLRARAAAEGISLSELVRRAVEQHIARPIQ
jgi:predicted HicB family RNase H-like nuclease